MVSGRPDLIIPCECGAGNCTVGPLIYNQQCLFVCCPKGLANGGGCGFMQWRDPNKTTTWHSHDNLPHPPPLFTTTVTIAEEYTPPFTAAEEDSPLPPPPMTASQDAPPPPPPQTTAMMCPCCGAGSCSIGTAKNGHNFYSCSSCKFKKWCDAGSFNQCYICREEGHWHMDCPRLPPQTTTMMCPCCAGSCSIGIAKNARYFYSCSSCTFRKWCDAGSSSQCYICREEGHWHMDCPRLPPSAATKAANNNKIICFYCKLEGHYVARCPSKSRRRQN
ncbi:uncharacterized protein LOC144546034 [Carex rostrata]